MCIPFIIYFIFDYLCLSWTLSYHSTSVCYHPLRCKSYNISPYCILLTYYSLYYLSSSFCIWKTAYALQIMGQQEVSTSDSFSIKITQLLKLASNSKNWLIYHEQVLNTATAWGLCRHLTETVLQPPILTVKAGKFFLSADNKIPLQMMLL